MDDQSSVYIAPSDDMFNSSSETATQVSSLPGGESEQAEQSEMDLQLGSDNSPTMDVENISHSGSLVELDIIVPRESNSETDLEISDIIYETRNSINIDLSTDHSSILKDTVLKDALQYSLDTEIHDNTTSKPSTNDVSSDSLPGLELISSRSKEDSKNHSNEINSTTHDRDNETSLPYEVYARHIFNTPIPPPRNKNKLILDHQLTIDDEDLDMNESPRSKRLCRCEDLQASELELDAPSLDPSTSMDTANLMEDIPPMDTTLCIDASLTMETEYSLSPAPSYESISDIESIPDIPLCFSSTRRPLMFPNSENLSIKGTMNDEDKFHSIESI